MQQLGSSFGSGSSRKHSKNIHHVFKGKWGDGPIFDWYRGLADCSARSIQTLQIWKNISRPVPHRFIVLHTSDGLVHRFDRRPAKNKANKRVFVNYPVPSEDACELDIDFCAATRDSVCEIELSLGGEVDIMIVLSTCHSISCDNIAHEYSLLRYNCFFFSWTILMVVSRRYLPQLAPAPESIKPRLGIELNHRIELMVDDCLEAYIGLATTTTTVFRDKANSAFASLKNRPVNKAAWTPSTGLLLFVLQKSFKISWRCGLRAEFKKNIKKEIEKAVDYVQEASIAAGSAFETLDDHLWVEDFKDTIRKALETEIAKGIWVVILETVSAGLGDIWPEVPVTNLKSSSIQRSILGPTYFQLVAAFIAALHGGLQGAKAAKHSTKGLSHEQAFDAVWHATCDGSLNAAKKSVEQTSHVVNNPQNDSNWAFIWTIWKEAWDEAHLMVRPDVIEKVEQFVEHVISAGVAAVMQDIKQSTARTIPTRMPDMERKSFLGAPRKSRGNYTNSQLQEHMRRTIEKNTIDTETLNELHSTMARIWNRHSGFDLPVSTLFGAVDNDVSSSVH